MTDLLTVGQVARQLGAPRRRATARMNRRRWAPGLTKRHHKLNVRPTTYLRSTKTPTPGYQPLSRRKMAAPQSMVSNSDVTTPGGTELAPKRLAEMQRDACIASIPTTARHFGITNLRCPAKTSTKHRNVTR